MMQRVLFVAAPVVAAETILEFTLEDKADTGKELYYRRGSSACWGIPGLAPQTDGSINVVPDEGNFACDASGRDYDYYQHLYVPLIYDGKLDVFHKHEVYVAQVEFYGRGYNRSGSVEWEYGCEILGTDYDPNRNPDFEVSCEERLPTHDYSAKGYTVTIESAAASEVSV